jgi:signal transduction histidine kinase
MQRTIIRVLLVEDCSDDARLVRRQLERESLPHQRFEVRHAGALQPALDSLGKGETDVVLLDLHLPDSDGVETVLRVREAVPAVPIVVFTVTGDHETAAAALRAGAQDYLVKDEIAAGRAIHRAIHHAIERARIVAEKRQLQDRLLRAEKLESLGVLAAGAAFGFNTLIGTMLEEIDQALARPADARPLHRGLCRVRVTALRAARVAEELRDYARSKPPQPGPVHLSELVLEAHGMIEAIAGRDAEVSYDLDSSLPAFPGSAVELRHLLLNLVVNAAEAVEGSRGSIAVSTGSLWAERELLTETQGASNPPEGRYLYLRVRDSGPGIEARASERIFDPFFSTKFAGRGLGLSAAFGIARRHGGVIQVRSEPGRGAEFSVLFPSPEAAR